MLRSTGKMPRHVAIIMDGNGRWAQERGRLRIDGHKEGMESVRAAVKTSSQLGIKYLTLYAFSIENWKRPVPEVRFLMSLLESYLRKEVDELHDNGVRIKTIGKTNALPKSVQRVLQEAIERTAENVDAGTKLWVEVGHTPGNAGVGDGHPPRYTLARGPHRRNGFFVFANVLHARSGSHHSHKW